jgi:hypothetical protein
VRAVMRRNKKKILFNSFIYSFRAQARIFTELFNSNKLMFAFVTVLFNLSDNFSAVIFAPAGYNFNILGVNAYSFHFEKTLI